ncbi:hypothetical protein [Paraburkholderia lycopersici]|uniref:Uncharacterized protein n=1 Tax=Paraburkholderia lycopersici TaxID=416944 RepID=A0A1G7BYQ9_9BURK|nr:hypothetical protein [Paraburkholderia lycopersici]SDE32192.1 hypothetical protein SAMN05421548_1423 [Paraburkholderia lycopersici]
MKHPISGWLLAVFLLTLAGVSSGEPVKAKHTRKAAHSHAAAAVPGQSTPPLALPAISTRYEYQSPFEKEYGAHLAKTTAATPGTPDETADAHEVAPGEARTPGAQGNGSGVPYQALHPQMPPLVTVGDWDLSADAHLPLTHTHDTGAAISARHGF